MVRIRAWRGVRGFLIAELRADDLVQLGSEFRFIDVDESAVVYDELAVDENFVGAGGVAEDQGCEGILFDGTGEGNVVAATKGQIGVRAGNRGPRLRGHGDEFFATSSALLQGIGLCG